jgi:hypothetical protein
MWEPQRLLVSRIAIMEIASQLRELFGVTSTSEVKVLSAATTAW